MDRSIIIAALVLIASFFGCDGAEAHEPYDLLVLTYVKSERQCIDVGGSWYRGKAPSFCYYLRYR